MVVQCGVQYGHLPLAGMGSTTLGAVGMDWSLHYLQHGHDGHAWWCAPLLYPGATPGMEGGGHIRAGG